MLTRRTTLAAAAALAVTAALPCALQAGGLTAEERRLMARLPAHVTTAERAEVLALLRDANPALREVMRRIIEMTPEQRRRAVVWIEADLAAREGIASS